MEADLRRLLLVIAALAVPGMGWCQVGVDYNSAINSAPSTAGVIAKCAPDGDINPKINMDVIAAVKKWGTPLLQQYGLFNKSWVGLDEKDPKSIKKMLINLTNYTPAWADEVDRNSREGEFRQALAWAAALEYEIFMISHPDGGDHKYSANLVAQKTLACIKEAREHGDGQSDGFFDKYYRLLKPQSEELYSSTLMYYGNLYNNVGPHIYYMPTDRLALESVSDPNVSATHARLILACRRSKDDADVCDRYASAIILAAIREAKKRFPEPALTSAP
jgi:hypothetical protein